MTLGVPQAKCPDGNKVPPASAGSNDRVDTGDAHVRLRRVHAPAARSSPSALGEGMV
jgi:hypothetical protein